MHVLSIDQFTKTELEHLLHLAALHQQTESNYFSWGDLKYPYIEYMHQWEFQNKKWSPILTKGKILTNLFYEPSTRTSSSFYSAMVKLGGSVIPINDVNYSSVSKGETLEDTIRTLQCYSDLIALRHPEVGAAERASMVADVPIINAGDGIGEHPTQALLDFMTIVMEKGWTIYNDVTIDEVLNGITVTLLGDLKHGRTVKSLAKLLRHYNVSINWVAPEMLRISEDHVSPTDNETEHLYSVIQSTDNETEHLYSVIQSTDVLYVTRVQRERFDPKSISYDEVSKVITPFQITEDHMKLAKPNMVLMHPLPRVNEIPASLDSDPRSAYFRQMKYGLYMRMAVIHSVLAYNI